MFIAKGLTFGDQALDPYEDLKVEEIGEILHKKPSTVRAQLTRARSKLKEILKEGYDV